MVSVLSIEIPTIYRWWPPSVADPSDEMYGMIYGRNLLSMDMPSIYGWWISMSGMQHSQANVANDFPSHRPHPPPSPPLSHPYFEIGILESRIEVSDGVH